MAANAQGSLVTHNERAYWDAVSKDLEVQAKRHGVGRGFKEGGMKPLPEVSNTKFVKVNGKFVFHKM